MDKKNLIDIYESDSDEILTDEEPQKVEIPEECFDKPVEKIKRGRKNIRVVSDKVISHCQRMREIKAKKIEERRRKKQLDDEEKINSLRAKLREEERIKLIEEKRKQKADEMRKNDLEREKKRIEEESLKDEEPELTLFDMIRGHY